LVEHLLCKQGVVGSIPSISTTLFGEKSGLMLLQGVIKFQFWSSAIPEKVCGGAEIGCCFPD
jgi:hypothetical protein